MRLCGPRLTGGIEIKSVRPSAAISRPASRRCRTASAMSSRDWWLGHANKQGAYDLGISPRTIENYRANLMIKMQAASLSDLARMALIAGILDPNSDQSNAS